MSSPTTWADGPGYMDILGDLPPWDHDGDIFCRYSGARRAHLADVFTKASVSKALIVWKANLPVPRNHPKATGKLLQFMEDAWGELPPFIEVEMKCGEGRFIIKPVWSEPADE